VQQIVRQIPNFLTLCNLFAGSVSAVLLFQQMYRESLIFFFISLATDYLDGLAARWLGVQSQLGKYLDALADVISFGLLPGLAYYVVLNSNVSGTWLPFAGFLFTVFAAIRLARFVQIEDRDFFSGLPTPAAATFAMGLVSISHLQSMVTGNWISSPAFLLLSLVVLCILMVTNLKMFSMKILSAKILTVQWLALVGSVVLIILLGWASLSFIIILYIGLSFIPTGKKVR
jgi:CDP-diacylglycerol--serine O-phosphatidyltransferase